MKVMWFLSCAMHRIFKCSLISAHGYRQILTRKDLCDLYCHHIHVVYHHDHVTMFKITGWRYVGTFATHDGVIKWIHFPRYWPFVRGILRKPGNSPHKGQWRRALMLSLICARSDGWINNRDADDLRRHHVHYDPTAMIVSAIKSNT